MFLVFQPSSLLSLDHRRTNTNATSRTANIYSNIIDAYIIHRLRFFESMVILIYISLTIRYIIYSMNNHSFVIAVLISVSLTLFNSPSFRFCGWLLCMWLFVVVGRPSPADSPNQSSLLQTSYLSCQLFAPPSDLLCYDSPPLLHFFDELILKYLGRELG